MVTNNEDKNEESTQDPQWHGLQPEWNNKDEHPVNNTRDELIPEVFPEIQSGSERHPTSPTASKSFVFQELHPILTFSYIKNNEEIWCGNS